MNNLESITYTFGRPYECIYADIKEKLPKEEEIEGRAILRHEVGKNFFSYTTALIIEKALHFFADKDRVFLKRGDDLVSSLYLHPQKKIAYILTREAEQESPPIIGGTKKCCTAICSKIDIAVSIIKLSSRKNRSIYKEEIKANIWYSDSAGLGKIFAAFSYKTKSNRKKSVILSEKFDGNIEVLRKNKLCNYSLSDVKNIIYDTARALQKLHDQGVVHGDITERNILYKSKESGALHGALCDFAFLSKNKVESRRLSAEQVCKTPYVINNACLWTYPPESIQHLHDTDLSWVDTKEYDRRAHDVYALGIAMYSLLLKEDPVWVSFLKRVQDIRSISKEFLQAVINHQKSILDFVEQIEKQQDHEFYSLFGLILKMLDPDVKKRYTAAQIVEDKIWGKTL